MPSIRWNGKLFVKQCAGCEAEYEAEAKDVDEAYWIFRKKFSPRKTALDGLESSCFRCRAIAEMRIKFGIDVEEILADQNNCCAICETPIKFNTGDNGVSANVDHDHKSGETRGILCRHCNVGLGHFKDNPEIMRKAIKYLEEWQKPCA